MDGQYGSKAREELIEVQRELVERIKSEIYESIGQPSAALQYYYDQYRSRFHEHQGPIEIAPVIEDIATADVAYFGDYHTLRESQKAPLRILDELHQRGRPILFATEAVQLIHQDHVDAYLDGDLSETEFLEQIDYERTWGFPWRNYKLQFEFCRDRGIPMQALNSDPAILHDNLQFRDAMAAMVLVEAINRDPEQLVAVTFGDLHVTPHHLPNEVDRFARRRGLAPLRRVIVYQNSETVYWDLARQGLEQNTPAVRVDDESYCLLNSTPLVKFQSYLNWEMNTDELEESIGLDQGPNLSAGVMTEQVHELMTTITDFLRLPEMKLDDFTVHTSRDLNFLGVLENSGRYQPEELAEIRQQIARNDSYFITREKMIYLGNLSIDHAAEEATHYLNTKLAGHVRYPPSRRFDFYYRAVKEAIGFLGSRVINHKRSCHDREEFEEILQEYRGRRLPGPLRSARTIAQDVLQHWDYEERWLRGEVRGYPRFRSMYERDLPVHIGVTHSLGYVLGDQIYDALVGGRIHRAELQELFTDEFEHEARPREVYFDWIDYLKNERG